MMPLQEAGFDVSREKLLALAPLMRERLNTANELPTTGAYLFTSPNAFDDKQAEKRLKKADLDQLAHVGAILEGVSSWNAEQAGTQLKSWANEHEVKLGILLPLYRIALTGGMSGPDVFELGEVLGKEETIQRWETALAHFRSLQSNLSAA
jgi:glutamyl-tRNA synthetase